MDLFALAFPRFGRGGLAFDGLGFVSLDPTMLYVDGNGEGMEEGMGRWSAEKDEDEDEDADEQFERKVEVERVEEFWMKS